MSPVAASLTAFVFSARTDGADRVAGRAEGRAEPNAREEIGRCGPRAAKRRERGARVREERERAVSTRCEVESGAETLPRELRCPSVGFRS